MLHGKLVYLRTVEKEDLEQIRDWLTDPDLLHLLGARPIPIGTIEPDKIPELFRLRDGRALSILSRDKTLVGLVGFGNFHEFNRTAQMLILIGDRSEWNRGYGSDAIRNIVRFAFEDLNLNCVEVQIPQFNTRALRVFQKVGFTIEGTLRSRLFLRGRYWDLVTASALRDDALAADAAASAERAAASAEIEDAPPAPSLAPPDPASVPIGVFETAPSPTAGG